MQLGREARPLDGLELRVRRLDLLARELAAAALDEDAQRGVPDEDEGEHARERGEDDEEPPGRQPGRAREDDDVGLAAQDQREAADVGHVGLGVVVVGLKKADSRRLDLASKFQPLGRLAQVGEVSRRLRASPRAIRDAPLVRLDDLALDRLVPRQPRRQPVACRASRLPHVVRRRTSRQLPVLRHRRASRWSVSRLRGGRDGRAGAVRGTV